MLSRNLGRTAMFLGMLALTALALAQPAADKPNTDQSGDALPPGALARMGTVRWRHGDAVTYVAFTPDGKAVLTASRDNIIRLWDRATGKEIRRFEAKAGKAPVGVPGGMVGFYPGGAADGSRVALSKDGKVVAAIIGNAVIQLWDVDTGKEIRQLKAPAGATMIAFAPDGKKLAMRGFDRSTFVLDADTGKTICQIKAKPMPANLGFAFVTDRIPVVDVLAFSPDSKIIATLETEFDKQGMAKRHIKITDVPTGNRQNEIAAENGVASIAYSPDGKILAFGSGNKVHLREADTGKEIRQLDNKSAVATLTFAHDGKTLAAKGLDNVIRLFETETGKGLQEMRALTRTAVQTNQFFVAGNGGAAETRDIAFSHDDQTLAVGGTQALRFFSVATGKEQAAAGGHRAGVTSVLLAPDGKTMLSHGDDRVIRRWDAHTGKELGGFAEPSGATHVAFSPDGQTVAFANTDGTIRLKATADGKELHKLKGHANGFASLAFTPDSKILASRGTNDNIIRLFDVAKGSELKQINVPVQKQPNGSDFVVFGRGVGLTGQGFVFSPDGQTLAAYVGPNNGFNVVPQGQTPGKLVIWDVTTGKELRPITLPTSAVVTNLAYSPDGRLLAAQNGDGTVSLWEISSGKERAVLGEPLPKPKIRGGGGVVAVVDRGIIGPSSATSAPLGFSRDGSLLAVRGPGNAVRVWQIPHGKEIGLFKGHESVVNAVCFAADGKTLATASADTTLLVWDLALLKREPTAAAVELDAKEIDSLWADLAGSDAIKAGKSIQTLASAAKQTPKFLARKLKPAAPVDVKKLTQWVADLNSGNFATRNAATGELEKLGDLAIPALKKVLTSQPTLETQRRVESLLEKLTTGVLSPEQVRLVRAVEVLENLGTPEARQVLEALAQGAPGALPTRQAQTVLDRLAK